MSGIFIACLIILITFSDQHVMRIGNAEDNNEPRQKFQDFNFVAAGDFGCTEEAKTTIHSMISKGPELVIALGDLAYKKNPDCWFDIISPIPKNRIKISFGAHDVSRGNNTYHRYLDYFNLTKPYYSFDYGNVHFLAMATAKNKVIPYNLTSKQYEFVNNDLKSAHENKSINWIVVYSFRSFYSSNTTHPGLDELQDLFHPLFEKYGVNIVLQAHNHNYQRTYPISYNVTKQFTPIIMNRDTEMYRDEPKGPIFVTVGTGGEDLHNFTGQAPYVITQFMRNGFLNVDVTKNGTELVGTFYENRHMSDEDHFRFIKKLN